MYQVVEFFALYWISEFHPELLHGFLQDATSVIVESNLLQDFLSWFGNSLNSGIHPDYPKLIFGHSGGMEGK